MMWQMEYNLESCEVLHPKNRNAKYLVSEWEIFTLKAT